MENSKCCYYKKRRCSKSKRKLKKTSLIFLGIFVALVLVISLILSTIVNPVILNVSQAKIKSLTTQAVSKAITSVMINGVTYPDIITITKDNNGKIAYIQANSIVINSLGRRAAEESQINIEKIGEQGIEIPFGTLTGITLLAGYGSNIVVRVVPVGSVVCEFASEFVTAGINQTRHKIYLNIIANVSLVLPGINLSIPVLTQVLISESIIIGEVPATYLQSNSIDEMLNLIP